MKKLCVFLILLVLVVPFFAAQAGFNEPVHIFASPALGFSSFSFASATAIETLALVSMLLPAMAGFEYCPIDVGYIAYYLATPMLPLTYWYMLDSINRTTDIWVARGVVFDKSLYEKGFLVTMWTITGLAAGALIIPPLLNNNIWAYSIVSASLVVCTLVQELIIAESWMNALNKAIKRSQIDWKSYK